MCERRRRITINVRVYVACARSKQKFDCRDYNAKRAFAFCPQNQAAGLTIIIIIITSFVFQRVSLSNAYVYLCNLKLEGPFSGAIHMYIHMYAREIISSYFNRRNAIYFMCEIREAWLLGCCQLYTCHYAGYSANIYERLGIRLNV